MKNDIYLVKRQWEKFQQRKKIMQFSLQHVSENISFPKEVLKFDQELRIIYCVA